MHVYISNLSPRGNLDTITMHENLEIRDASKEVNSIYVDIYH
jgi:hypothetical protein